MISYISADKSQMTFMGLDIEGDNLNISCIDGWNVTKTKLN